MTKTRRNIKTRQTRAGGYPSYIYRIAQLGPRAAFATSIFTELKETINKLLQDENFVTLLRAEALLSLPRCLQIKQVKLK